MTTPTPPTPSGGTSEFDDVATQPVSPDDLAARNSYGEVARQIAGYTLIERIGSGGMGEVWVAEQSQPVKRRVALKLIKEGFGSREVVARFEAERQALALMNHPNIARILDAGTTDDGQPYFVMELVDGQPLTTFCDENRLSIDERLRLFTDACSGVQHAHQKGIIHRDLKPGNIIVGRQDGVPVPKVIDFGLAKAIENAQRLTDQSFTSIGQVLGTYKYMSPEQAGLENLDIDTRTDIYALGVILYELLTGSTPLDDSLIQGQATLKVLELIREREPVKPSSRLSSSTGEQVSSITGQRQTDSGRLKRILLGDLDWIVMKALEKDRVRRYDSVSGFADDIRRYLHNEPVVARPPSLNYRISKFVGKHRVAVISGCLLVFSLLAGVIGTTWGLFEADYQASVAKREAQEKDAARIDAQRQAEVAKDARTVAEERLASEQEARANEEAIFRFVIDDVLALTSEEGRERFGYPDSGDFRSNATLRDLLDRAAQKLNQRHDIAPAIAAELNWIIGLSYRAMGEAQQALPFLECCVETRISVLGSEHLETLNAQNSLAVAYAAAGKHSLSRRLYKRTVLQCQASLGHDHSQTLDTMLSLGLAQFHAGDWGAALSQLEQVLTTCKESRGLGDSLTHASISNLAKLYGAMNQTEQALPMHEEAFELSRMHCGPENDATLQYMLDLATALDRVGEFERSLPLYKEMYRLNKHKLGKTHGDTLISLYNLAACHLRLEEAADAFSLIDELGEALGAQDFDHKYSDQIIQNLIMAFENSTHHTIAENWWRKWLTFTEANHGLESEMFANRQAAFILWLMQRQKWETAEAVLRDSLSIQERKSAIWRNYNTRAVLGAVLQFQGKYEQATSYLLEGYNGMKLREDLIPPEVREARLTEALDQLIQLHVALDNPNEAEKYRSLRAEYE
jgi:serine/threonine protein kinase